MHQCSSMNVQSWCDSSCFVLLKEKKGKAVHICYRRPLLGLHPGAKVNAARVCAINHLPNCDNKSFLLLSAFRAQKTKS